ncbi:MAG: hypothetical protein KAJ55_16985 [Anaerolineales bacterium]|nr:hypothetical protein [Anaerolineales bacterium]
MDNHNSKMAGRGQGAKTITGSGAPKTTSAQANSMGKIPNVNHDSFKQVQSCKAKQSKGYY